MSNEVTRKQKWVTKVSASFEIARESDCPINKPAFANAFAAALRQAAKECHVDMRDFRVETSDVNTTPIRLPPPYKVADECGALHHGLGLICIKGKGHSDMCLSKNGARWWSSSISLEERRRAANPGYDINCVCEGCKRTRGQIPS